MTDVWDIAQYIEAHPDNHIQRWRLAKKLYMAWEYRLALEHLQILKNEWDKKINVSRYLAATYYRLTRYDDAIKELEYAIEAWPEELGLQEQLARTLDVAGRKDEAALVWQKIAEHDPDHPFAKRAVEHLRSIPGASHTPQPMKEASPRLAGDAQPEAEELQCPHCGSMNSPEFQRCWQCHGTMVAEDKATSSTEASTEKAQIEDDGPWGLVSGIVIVTLLAAGVYQMLGAYNTYMSPTTATSLYAYLSATFFWTKIIVAGTALVVWPLTWRVSAAFVGLDEVYNEPLYRCGGILAALTYALAWLPGSMIFLLLLAPALLSAALAFRALGAPPARALSLWIVQGLVMLLVTLTVIIGRHGPAPLLDASTLRAFSSQSGHSTLEQLGQTPLEVDLIWESSGSKWLDENASTIAISGTLGPHEKRILLELTSSGETLVFREFSGDRFDLDFSPIRPDTEYTLRLSGEDAIETSLSVRGVLKLQSSAN